MSQPRLFPFRQVAVDSMIRGVTRVWWQIEPTFNDPGPRVFQLQFGNTGLRDANDWRNVGGPVVDGYVAFDDAWRNFSSDLLTHYRVTLTTGTDIYVSQAVSCFGELAERDWVLAREVIRKEQLRHKYVSVSGYLLKPYRFGRPCKRCRDELTGEVLDSNCPVCNGTSFEVGYHPPLAMQCWDLSTQTIAEHQDDQLKGTTREEAEVTARVIGFPTINRNDIWVNGSSDERWLVHKIEVAAAMRGVPLIYNIQMGLIPFSSPIYAIEIGGEPAARPGPTPPQIGCGIVPVDHNFISPDYLSYADATGDTVEGALVYVFLKDIYDAAQPDYPDRAGAVASTTTRANGRWSDTLLLNPGNYAVLFEKPGEYGPNPQDITVVGSGQEPIVWENEFLGDSSEAVLTERSEAVGTEQQFPGPASPPDDFWNF